MGIINDSHFLFHYNSQVFNPVYDYVKNRVICPVFQIVSVVNVEINVPFFRIIIQILKNLRLDLTQNLFFPDTVLKNIIRQITAEIGIAENFPVFRPQYDTDLLEHSFDLISRRNRPPIVLGVSRYSTV